MKILDSTVYEIEISFKLKQSIIQIMFQQNHQDIHLTHKLNSLINAQWQQQIDILKSLPINQQLVKHINHRNYAADIASLLASHNPRSLVVTTLTEFLISLFSSYCSQLISFANLLISGDCLLRLLGNGNKVISSAANQILKCIISHVDFKTKSKLIKFVHCLETQFLGTKNNYVREKISLYFILISASFYYIVKDQLIQFQTKIVRIGLEDSCEKVRQNMKQILVNITNLQQQNLHFEKNVCSESMIKKSKLKKSRIPLSDKSQRGLNTSSINQSSIIQNFKNKEEEQTVQQSKVDQMSQNCFQFYLDRLSKGSAWPMRLMSYQALTEMIQKGCLITFKKQSIVCKALKELTPFLSQKKSKIYQTCVCNYLLLIQQITKSNNQRSIAFIQEQIAQIVQHAVKNESVASQLLPVIIHMNPQLFVCKLAELSLTLKVSKEKIYILDSIIKCLDMMFGIQQTKHSCKRITSIVRVMCQLITEANSKDRQLCLAALTIIAHLKSKQPDSVLTTLLCQSDNVLSKIIDLAESIDQSLKIAIINYINSLKGENQKTLINEKRNSPVEQLYHQIRLISDQKKTSLNKLGELIFTNLQELTTKDFKKILTLLQFLCSTDTIMQFTILLGELCKTNNKHLLEALAELLDQQLDVKIEEEQMQLREHHDILLIQILSIGIQEWKSETVNDHIFLHLATSLIKVYRRSKSLKKRNAVIQALTYLDGTILGDCLNQKEMQLTSAYKQKLLQNQDQLQL